MVSAEFESQVAPHRTAVLAHCYRMLGSMADADDALQETLLRAWRAHERFEARSTVKTWLYRIATNVCLDFAQARGARATPGSVGPPLHPGELPSMGAEQRWVEPAPPALWLGAEATPEARFAARESVQLAFVAVLQQMPAPQRAVLLCRDVLGFSAEETAQHLEVSVAAVNSALQRARAAVESGRSTRPADPELLRRYLQAWQVGDPVRFAQVLAEEVVLTMPPMQSWVSGRDAVVAFAAWLAQSMGKLRLLELEISGGGGAAVYLQAPGDHLWRASSLHVLEANQTQVVRVHSFLLPGLFERFGLPATLQDENAGATSAR